MPTERNVYREFHAAALRHRLEEMTSLAQTAQSDAGREIAQKGLEEVRELAELSRQPRKHFGQREHFVAECESLWKHYFLSVPGIRCGFGDDIDLFIAYLSSSFLTEAG